MLITGNPKIIASAITNENPSFLDEHTNKSPCFIYLYGFSLNPNNLTLLKLYLFISSSNLGLAHPSPKIHNSYLILSLFNLLQTSKRLSYPFCDTNLPLVTNSILSFGFSISFTSSSAFFTTSSAIIGLYLT